MAVLVQKGRSLESTATWAVAVVCFVLIAISTVIDKFIHRFETWLRKKRNPSLCEAHEKIKTEVMLLGFMSLLLSLVQQHLSEVCVPTSVGHSWHPCNKDKIDRQYPDPCQKGKAQLVSAYGINQLHVFIFVLAVSHVICCAATLGLGRLKIRKWKSWEEETNTVQYQCYNDPERFRFARETTFARRHLHCVFFWAVLHISCKSGLLNTQTWIYNSTSDTSEPSKIQFSEVYQQITGRRLQSFSRDKSCNMAICCSVPPHQHQWVVFTILATIHPSNFLLIGTKFQVIITKMGISILERGVIIKGTPVVQPGDHLFWFSRPRLILFLIHFVLFENAFQIAFFTWSWYEFGFPSCYHENFEEMIIRVTMGVTIQVLCSYVTLPLYALVTQMGSSVKPVIFSQQVTSSLRAWHLIASKRLKQRRQSGSTTPVDGGASPVHLLRGHNNYNELNEGRDGGGKGTSEPPSYRDLDETVRKSRPLDQINRDETEISLGNFSFGNKQYLVGMSGSTSAFPSHRDMDDTVRNSRPLGQIERDDIEISSRDFSFRIKQDLSGVSGSKW